MSVWFAGGVVRVGGFPYRMTGDLCPSEHAKLADYSTE